LPARRFFGGMLGIWDFIDSVNGYKKLNSLLLNKPTYIQDLKKLKRGKL